MTVVTDNSWKLKIDHFLGQFVSKSPMSSHSNEALSDVLSENVQELLNGEFFNSERIIRRTKTKFNRFNSMNTDDICQTMVSGNFSSLQNINSSNDVEFIPPEDVCSTGTNGCPESDKTVSSNEDFVGKVLLTDASDALPESETEHLKNLIKEKDLQLLTAAQYGISLVNKSSELEALLEKEKEVSKEKLEVSLRRKKFLLLTLRFNICIWHVAFS